MCSLLSLELIESVLSLHTAFLVLFSAKKIQEKYSRVEVLVIRVGHFMPSLYPTLITNTTLTLYAIIHAFNPRQYPRLGIKGLGVTGLGYL